jgi:O-antigen/teichoic acid export membrane protein
MFFFGPNWRGAGEILVILMPALALKFVVSTLSLSFIATGHLRLLALWQILSFTITALVFLVFGKGGDIVGFFWAYMVKDLILYFVYYIMIVYAITHPNLRHSTS